MIKKTLHKIYRYLFPIKTSGKNNTIKMGKVHKKGLQITIRGNNNTIIIGDNCRLWDLNIYLAGDNNTLILADRASFLGTSSITQLGNSTVQIGEKTGIRGCNIISKDANITIGDNCMFSYGITLRNNDIHKIFDITTQSILNHPRDIRIANHVWIAPNATILKGATIHDNSIIGANAVITKECPQNSIMAGNPAKIVKQNINWDF